MEPVKPALPQKERGGPRDLAEGTQPQQRHIQPEEKTRPLSKRKIGGPGKGSVRLAWDRFFRIKMCPWIAEGCCRHGDLCNYAHTPEQLRPWLPLYKTKLCDAFKRGECTNEECNFAHGAEELRHTTGYYKTELCQLWLAGSCPSRDVCRHAHGVEELRPKTQLARKNIALLLGSQAQGTTSKETTTATEEEDATAVGGSLGGQGSKGSKQQDGASGAGDACSKRVEEAAKGSQGDSENKKTATDEALGEEEQLQRALHRLKLNSLTDRQPQTSENGRDSAACPTGQQQQQEEQGEQQQQQEQQEQQQQPVAVNGVTHSSSLSSAIPARRKTGGTRKVPKQQQQDGSLHQQQPRQRRAVSPRALKQSGSQQQSQQQQQQQVQQNGGARVLRGFRLSRQGLETASPGVVSAHGGAPYPAVNSSKVVGHHKVSADSALGTPQSLTPAWCLVSSPSPSVEEGCSAEEGTWPLGSPLHQLPPCGPACTWGALASAVPPNLQQLPGTPHQHFGCFAQNACELTNAVPHLQALFPFPPASQGLVAPCFCQRHPNAELLHRQMQQQQMQQQQQPPQQQHGHSQHAPCVCQFTAACPVPPSGAFLNPIARSVPLASAGSVGWGPLLVSPPFCLLQSPTSCPQHGCVVPRAPQWHEGMGAPVHGGGAERIFCWMQQVPLKDLQMAASVERYED